MCAQVCSLRKRVAPATPFSPLACLACTHPKQLVAPTAHTCDAKPVSLRRFNHSVEHARRSLTQLAYCLGKDTDAAHTCPPHAETFQRRLVVRQAPTAQALSPQSVHLLLQPFDGLFEAVPVEGEMVVQEAGLAEPTVEPGAETHCDEKIFLRRARSVCLGSLPLVHVDDASYALRPRLERGQVESTAVHACRQGDRRSRGCQRPWR